MIKIKKKGFAQVWHESTMRQAELLVDLIIAIHNYDAGKVIDKPSDYILEED
jgi:hypothetical protein